MNIRRVATMILTAALLLQPSLVRAAPPMSWGVSQAADVVLWRTGCSATNQIWTKEFGKSGVTRFRMRWELRSPYDTGWLPTYAKTSYLYSNSFPNDARSFYQYFTLRPGAINFAGNKQFGLWVKIVGERPSFWQRDIVLKSETARLGCNLGPGGA